MKSETEIKDRISQLSVERKQLEDDIINLNEMETVEMKGRPTFSPLVDSEGFPLSDVDVHNVRVIRHDIICKQNDIRALNKELESLMFDLHAILIHQQTSDLTSDNTEDKEETNNNNNQTDSKIKNGESEEKVDPFAKIATLTPIFRVGTVADLSPAAEAGVCEGDLIMKMNEIDSSNDLSSGLLGVVAREVESVADNASSIVLICVRDGEYIQLSLKPKTWEGRGKLGCMLVPL